jgi:uncharacterized protein HemY
MDHAQEAPGSDASDPEAANPEAKYAPFLAVLETDPDDPLVHFGLARMYAADERWEDALGFLRKTVELDPSYSVAYRELGRALEALEDPAGAAEAYRQGLPHAEAKGDLMVVRELKGALARLSSDD